MSSPNRRQYWMTQKEMAYRVFTGHGLNPLISDGDDDGLFQDPPNTMGPTATSTPWQALNLVCMHVIENTNPKEDEQ